MKTLSGDRCSLLAQADTGFLQVLHVILHAVGISTAKVLTADHHKVAGAKGTLLPSSPSSHSNGGHDDHVAKRVVRASQIVPA